MFGFVTTEVSFYSLFLLSLEPKSTGSSRM